MGLKVAYISSEVVPFSKTGGLADVAGSLPLALKALGMEVAVFTPFYSTVECGFVKALGKKVSVEIGGREVEGELFAATVEGVEVYLIKSDIFFDRGELYGTKSGPYFDNLARFSFFSRAVLEALKELDFSPDIIHCNDWQTGLVPAYLKDLYKGDDLFSETATLYTIHNLAYQGVFDSSSFADTGLSPELNSVAGLEFWGSINLMKSGIVFADVITTVSKTYCKEIQTKEFGCGLNGVLAHRKESLFGVLNGVDYSIWDPAVDPLIAANYSSDNPKCKVICKRDLLERFGIAARPGVPVVGIISRLDVQKGFDIIKEAAGELMDMDLTLIVLGSGGREYEEFFEELAALYPDRVGVKIGYDNELAHLIEAGSDIFLMPSYYEPCGLNQIYSLRYGAVPVVRATGGLNDTIRDYAGGKGNGFKFKKYTARALVAKLSRAIELYNDKKAWGSLMRRTMKEDHSWELSAKSYRKLYRQTIKKLHKI